MRIAVVFLLLMGSQGRPEVIDRILAMVPPPTPVWNRQQRETSHQQHRYDASYDN